MTDVNTNVTAPPVSAAMTLLQYALTAGLSFLIGSGKISATDAGNIAAAVPVVAAAGWGVYKSFKHGTEKTALVNGTANLVTK